MSFRNIHVIRKNSTFRFKGCTYSVCFGRKIMKITTLVSLGTVIFVEFTLKTKNAALLVVLLYE